MRADMAKVIVERPRIGSREPARKKGYRKYVQSRGLEDLPRREPMLGRWRGRGKWLNEHLSPMRRFLLSNVGRPWDHVHRDLCEYVSFENAVQAHVLSHVFQFVKQHVEIRGRDVVDADTHRGRVLCPGEMYICPKTGLLRLVRPKRNRSMPTRIGEGRPLQYHYRDGVWWKLVLHSVPQESTITHRRHSPRRSNPAPKWHWDVWLERTLSFSAPDDEAELAALYGGRFIAVSKRPLTAQETRELLRRTPRPTRRRLRWSC